MGINQPRTAGIVVRYGFTQQELDEGWRRLRAVAGERLNAPPPRTRDPEAIERLDDWENMAVTLQSGMDERSESMELQGYGPVNARRCSGSRRSPRATRSTRRPVTF